MEQQAAEKKRVEEMKKEEFQKQLAKLEHVKQKIELERQKEEEKNRQKNSNTLHWTAKVRCIFISDIVESAEVKDKVEMFYNPNLGFRIRVKSILKIKPHPEVLEEQEEYLRNLFEPQRRVMKFYGNSTEVISNVISTGRFFPSKYIHKKPTTVEEDFGEEDLVGDFGYGVYFTSDSNASALHGGVLGKYLLYCEVWIGKPLEVTDIDPTLTYNELTDKGYDSVYLPRDRVGEY